jgi:hypothetical protein
LRLAVPDQHLVRVDGNPYNRQVKLLYLDRSAKLPRHCLMCLRVFEATPALRGRPPKFCSGACRSRYADPMRRVLPRAWRQCETCGADFLCLDLTGFGGTGLWTCPLPAPASYWTRGDGLRSECAMRRTRELERQAAQRWRDRQGEAGKVRVWMPRSVTSLAAGLA